MFMIVSPCESSTILKTIYFIMEIINVAFILIPIGLIIMVSVDFAKNIMAVSDDEMKKNTNLAIKRIIICIAMFLVPIFVRTSFNMLHDANIFVDYTQCIANATPEKIMDLEVAETIEKQEKEEKYTPSAPTDPNSNTRKIVPGGNNNNNNNTTTSDDPSGTTVKAENANAQAFLDALQKMSDQAKKDYKAGHPWRYHWYSRNRNIRDFSYLEKHDKHTVCIAFVSLGLIEVGVFKQGQYIQNKANGWGPRYVSKKHIEKYLKKIDMHNERQNTLIKKGKFKPGDIVFYSGNHQNVYAGNGKFYDGGHSSCTRSGDQAPFKSFGPIKHGNERIYAVYRWKE